MKLAFGGQKLSLRRNVRAGVAVVERSLRGVSFPDLEGTVFRDPRRHTKNMKMKNSTVFRYPPLKTRFSLWRKPVWRNGAKEGVPLWVCVGALRGVFGGVCWG